MIITLEKIFIHHNHSAGLVRGKPMSLYLIYTCIVNVLFVVQYEVFETSISCMI